MRGEGAMPDILKARIARFYERNGRFVRAVFVYGVGQVGLKALDLVVFAILVRMLTKAEFGLVAAVTLIGYVITEILSLGLFRAAVPRFVLDGPDVREKVLASALGGFLIYAAIICLAALAVPPAWATAAGVGGHDVALKVFVLSFVLRAFVVMELEILRMDHRALRQSVLEALPSGLNLLGVAALLPMMADKVQAVAYASLASQGIPFLAFFGLALSRRRPSLSDLPELLRFSGPTVIHRTLADINNLASRWIVLLTAGLTAAGVYTFLIRIGDILRLTQAPMTKAWTPAVLTVERDGDARPARHATILLLVLSTAIFLVSLPLAPLLADLIDNAGKYREAHGAIGVVLFAGWILTFQQVFGIGFLVAKRPGQIAPITAVAALTNVVGSYLLLKYVGLLAVPYAAVASNAVFAVLSAYFGRHYFAIGSPRLRLVAWACLAAGALGFVVERLFA